VTTVLVLLLVCDEFFRKTKASSAEIVAINIWISREEVEAETLGRG
jgi:hypothetical protein